MQGETDVQGLKCAGKREQIEKIPRPKNIRQLRVFLGVLGYYSRFFKNYANAVGPLYELLKKNQKWRWTTEHESVFNNIKRKFKMAITLKHPDFNRTFYVQTDSSGFAVGAILYQKNEENGEQIIALASRILHGAEKSYSTTLKEALGVVFALENFREYVMGRHFVIITDHKALTFLNKCHVNNDKLLRWSLWLQQFSFEIKHIAGKDNVLPDYLSRNPKGGEISRRRECLQCV